MSKGKRDYVVQKNIPIPEGKTTMRKYPFLEMGTGDSFTVSYEEMRNTHTAIQDYKRRYGLYFVTKMYQPATTRGTKNRAKQRMRIWRVDAPEEEVNGG
jgi:hypothetical protein